MGLENVRSRAWIASVLVVADVALLSIDKGHGTVSSRTGDVFEIVSATFFSFEILQLGEIECIGGDKDRYKRFIVVFMGFWIWTGDCDEYAAAQ